MKKLSKEAKNKALSFLNEQGRPLDQARYAFHFEDRGAEAVLRALSVFQNEDGGFGHGLEPDLRTPFSSVVTTCHAFQILEEAGAEADHPMVQQGIAYLLDQYDEDKRVWPMIPPEAEETPHPCWWNFNTLEESFGGYLINPRARVLAHLWAYKDLVPLDFLRIITRVFMDNLLEQPDEIGQYDLQSCMKLLEVEALPQSYRLRLEKKLIAAIPLSAIQSPEEIGSHKVTPLFLVSAPESPLYKTFDPALVDANLDWLLDTQMEDGSWQLGWDWSEIDAGLWAQAEKDWKGAYIVDHLKILRDFGRI